MMNEQHITEQLWEFYLGNLSEEENQRIQLHLEVCEACFRESGVVKQAVQEIAVERSQEIPPFLYTRIQGRLESVTKSAPVWKRALVTSLGSILLLVSIWGGVKIGTMDVKQTAGTSVENPMGNLAINEMVNEPIEGYLFDFN
jgi:predicted anti-sigma-YlaC factor YlaD